jgi:ribosome maturation factor RimP
LEEVFVIEIQQKIKDLVAPILEPMQAYLVDVHIGFGDKRKIIQLFVDTDAGITIDACASISRQLGAILEADNVIEDPFVLQVSSPGATKPLKLLRQYPRNIGRKLRVRFHDGTAEKEIVGVFQKIHNETIVLTDAKKVEHPITYQSIIESTVELPW